MNADQPKRRRYPRIPSANAVLVKRLDDRPIEELAVTRVVGEGGCSIVASEAFGVGTHLRVLITVNHEVIETRAKVVYEKPLDGGRQEIGVHFVGINEKDCMKIAGLFELEESATGS